jgi:branched-chain amino acid transport system permease protein
MKSRLPWWIAGALLVLALPLLTDLLLGRSWVRLLDFALLYAMLALGLNIVVGYAGLLDLGYVAFYAVGAYAYAMLASPHLGIHWPLWVVLPIGALLAASFGALLGAPTLGLRGDYLAIVTMGFGEIIRVFLRNLGVTNGPAGIDLIDPISIGGYSFASSHSILGWQMPGIYSYYFLFLLLTAGIVMISRRLEDSRIGRAWAAIREDEIAAKSMGLNTRNLKLLAFSMGATFGGISGALFAGFQGFVSPESFTLGESVMILCMVVLGGMGHISGVVMGALLLAILPEAIRPLAQLQQSALGHVWLDPANLRMLLFAVALIAVMILRPEGLWPSPVRKRELHAPAGGESTLAANTAETGA